MTLFRFLEIGVLVERLTAALEIFASMDLCTINRIHRNMKVN